jgi:integrase
MMPVATSETLKRGGQGRDRTVDLPIFSRTLVPTELPGRAPFRPEPWGLVDRLATPTGLEPATSAVTGRRANQLRYGALLVLPCVSPTGFEPVLPP